MGVGGSTVYHTKRRFVLGNMEAALREEPPPGQSASSPARKKPKVATARSNPPAGRARWTLELLADAIVKLMLHESLSRETVRRRLAENDLKPWRKDMWCIPQIDADYVARMEDVLDLYAEAPDLIRSGRWSASTRARPSSSAKRQPIPATPGQIERYDCEYRRNGTANLFVFLDAHRSWRKVKVTERRTAEDIAACMRDLVDIHYPRAERIRLVLDNLSTHSAGALY
nr:IS630 family transposase [Bradyrhizobium diazoefficiens]